MGDYELYHHGIKGQRWGVRRYQNYDGTRKQGYKAKYFRDPKRLARDVQKDKSLSTTQRSLLMKIASGDKAGARKDIAKSFTSDEVKSIRSKFKAANDAGNRFNEYEMTFGRLHPKTKAAGLVFEKINDDYVNYCLGISPRLMGRYADGGNNGAIVIEAADQMMGVYDEDLVD